MLFRSHSAKVQDLGVEIKDDYRVDRIVGRVTYYLIMLFVLVLFFDILGVSTVMGPFLVMAGEFTSAVPNFVKAGLILLVAWLLASLLRGIVVRLLANRQIGGLLGKLGVVESEEAQQEVVSTAGNLVYYLVLLVFLPGVLGALQLEGMQAPFEMALATVLTYLPQVMAAGLTILVGYIAAKVVRGITTHFLHSAGIDSLPGKVGMEQIFQATPLSRAIGAVLFVLILIPVAISALETLGVEAISGPAISMLTVVLNMIPSVAVAILLLAVGIAVARWVGRLTTTLLENSNAPRFLARWGLLRGEKDESVVPAVLGNVVSGLIILLVLVEVMGIMHLTVLSALLRDMVAYLPNVVVAVVILAAGWAVALFADRSLRAVLAQSTYPVWLASVARSAIVTVTAMMALEQLGVARAIVVNSFTILLGSMGLAAAIAVGLGAKDAVQRFVDQQAAKRQDQQ